MAYSTIDKPNTQFNTVLYTGTGSTQTITTGFEPDFTWIKRRNSDRDHCLFNVISGANTVLSSNLTSVEEGTGAGGWTASSTGFDVGVFNKTNSSGDTYASWNWKAGGTAVSNTVGDIASQVSANTTAGFSIVSYTGTGANATVGHGLGVVPKMIIVKNRSVVSQWEVYHVTNGNTSAMQLSGGGIPDVASTYWNNTSPTSALFSIGTGTPTNGSGNSIISYCFAEKKGFSKFGSYVGNGNADGTFVYTGFKPAFVMWKGAIGYGGNYGWYMMDNKRNTFNPEDKFIYANGSSAEATNTFLDFLSNGFKIKTTGDGHNNSGSTYIYMAFAEAPIVGSNNVPANAR